MITLGLLALSVLAPNELRVYHVGNSVTDTLRYPVFQKAIASTGRKYVYGRHMIPGAPLQWLWEHPEEGFMEEPFGYPKKALSEFEWDAVSLQPFDRQLSGPDGDLAMARNYLDLLFAKSPKARVLMYQRWPRRSEDGSLDYASVWAKTYTGQWDGSNETRDYFAKVFRAVRAAYPGKERQFELVPVGDAMLGFDALARAGKIPGFESVVGLYVDGIHLGDLGSYLVGSTFYAVLFGRPSSDLDPSFWGLEAGPATRAVAQVVSHAVAASRREAKTDGAQG